MVWHLLGVKFRTRIGIIGLSICACVLFLLWKKRPPLSSNNNSAFTYYDPTCKVNDRCIYDTYTTSKMVNDDEIIVAKDKVTGQDWTLGHVRRDPTSEAWLLSNATPTVAESKSLYPSLVLEPNEKEVIPSAQNRTNGRFLIFNRVPKCATSMFVDLFWALMKKRNNHFRYYSWKNYWERQLTIDKENEFLHWLTVKKNEQYQYKFPFAMDRHVYFIDSKAYNIQKDLIPSWVNMVRDPVDRFVSLFNFLRTEHRWTNQLQKPPKEWFEKDINKCIISGDPECQFNPKLNYLKEHQLTYFCGSSPECKKIGSKAALQKAKYNAENNYAVIGVQDDIETSLCVMEHYLPLFFKRALKIYRTMGVVQFIQTENTSLVSQRKILSSHSKSVASLLSKKSMRFTKNETPHKQQISSLAREALKQNMTLEYEFYEFIKQRLKAQVKYLRKKMFPRNWCFDRTNYINDAYQNRMLDV